MKRPTKRKPNPGIVALLQRAAGFLRARQLCKASYQQGPVEDPTAVCALGALRYAVWGHPFTGDVGLRRYLLAHDFLARAIGDEAVSRWNDAPGRTKAQVLRAFEKAARLAQKDDG